MVRIKRSYPHRLDVAGRFSTDAREYLQRFRYTFYSTKINFQAIKTLRAKAYVDLRMALEAALKAAIALRQPLHSGGEGLVKKIEKGGHSLSLALKEASALWRITPPANVQSLVDDCDKLPVGLRYSFDAWDFREASDDLYYRTIGDASWMKNLESLISDFSERLGLLLDRRSGIINAADLSEDYIFDAYSKYRKPKT